MSALMALLFSKVGAILAGAIGLAGALFAARQSGKTAERRKQTEEDAEQMEKLLNDVKANQRARATDSADPHARLREQSQDRE